MLDQLPGDGRHAAGRGDLLALDQLQRLLRVPFAHQHELAAAGDERGSISGEAAGGVEERHRQQRAAFCGAFGSGAGSGSPRRRKLRAAANTAGAMMLAVMLRWVPSAPFGLPVVPEV